jgi:hypothetical protein
MVRAFMGHPVGVSLPAPPPGFVVLVESPASPLVVVVVLLLSPPLLAPLLELEVASDLLLPPQPEPSKTDPKARAHVSESTFRNIAMFDKCQLVASVRQPDTCNHTNLRGFMRIFQWAKSTKVARKIWSATAAVFAPKLQLTEDNIPRFPKRAVAYRYVRA